MKTPFVSYENYMKFTGSLLYEKEDQYLISLGIMKSNGNIYFGHNLKLAVILELANNQASRYVPFSVMMFNKKLYGRMAQFPLGCYGCWEINLTWEDELPGKILH